MDEEAELRRRRERWAHEPLPVFRVVDWAGPWSMASGGAALAMSSDGAVVRRTEMSRSVGHRDPADRSRSITVTSHRPENPAELRDWAPTNMLIAAARSGLPADATPAQHNRRFNRLRRDAATGKIPWTQATLRVDAVPVEFDVMTAGEFWSGVAFLPDVYVTIDSRRVPVGEVALTRVTDPPPLEFGPLEMFRPPHPREKRFPRTRPVGDVPDDKRVDLTYTDGHLTGTARGAQVELTLSVPASRATASGTFGGTSLKARWAIAPNAETHPDVPASLEGTFGQVTATLAGTFHLDPGFRFDHGAVTGDFGGDAVSANIEAADGGFGGSRTVAAEGSFAGAEFALFGTVSGDLTKAKVRGTISGNTIALDATNRHGQARVWGRYEGPDALLAVIVGALLFFL
ncbi:MAG TPA: hypothetical protein VFA83_19105 [Acidimicrobiales bacterium]|nr:hypothetical protein [Acidimicrobiales bacterium]